jgi:hypothetical protein
LEMKALAEIRVKNLNCNRRSGRFSFEKTWIGVILLSQLLRLGRESTLLTDVVFPSVLCNDDECRKQPSGAMWLKESRRDGVGNSA